MIVVLSNVEKRPKGWLVETQKKEVKALSPDPLNTPKTLLVYLGIVRPTWEARMVGDDNVRLQEVGKTRIVR